MISVCQKCCSKSGTILKAGTNGTTKLYSIASQQQSRKLYQKSKPLLYHGTTNNSHASQIGMHIPKLDSQGTRQLNSLIDGLSLQTQSYTASARNQSYAERRLLGYSMEQMYEVRPTLSATCCLVIKCFTMHHFCIPRHMLV